MGRSFQAGCVLAIEDEGAICSGQRESQVKESEVLRSQNIHTFCARSSCHIPNAVATDISIVSGKALKVDGMEAALSNSFGFGGVNAALLFTR